MPYIRCIQGVTAVSSVDRVDVGINIALRDAVLDSIPAIIILHVRDTLGISLTYYQQAIAVHRTDLLKGIAKHGTVLFFVPIAVTVSQYDRVFSRCIFIELDRTGQDVGRRSTGDYRALGFTSCGIIFLLVKCLGNGQASARRQRLAVDGDSFAAAVGNGAFCVFIRTVDHDLTLTNAGQGILAPSHAAVRIDGHIAAIRVQLHLIGGHIAHLILVIALVAEAHPAIDTTHVHGHAAGRFLRRHRPRVTLGLHQLQGCRAGIDIHAAVDLAADSTRRIAINVDGKRVARFPRERILFAIGQTQQCRAVLQCVTLAVVCNTGRIGRQIGGDRAVAIGHSRPAIDRDIGVGQGLTLRIEEVELDLYAVHLCRAVIVVVGVAAGDGGRLDVEVHELCRHLYKCTRAHGKDVCLYSRSVIFQIVLLGYGRHLAAFNVQAAHLVDVAVFRHVAICVRGYAIRAISCGCHSAALNGDVTKV